MTQSNTLVIMGQSRRGNRQMLTIPYFDRDGEMLILEGDLEAILNQIKVIEETAVISEEQEYAR